MTVPNSQSAMGGQPLVVRLVISQRKRDWILLRDGVEQGLYVDRSAACRVAELVAQQIRSGGGACELVIQDEAWVAQRFPDPED